MQQSSGPEQMKLFLNKQVVRKRPALLRNFRMLMMRSAWLGLVMKAIREEGSTRWLEQPAAKPIGMLLVEQNWDTNPILFFLYKLSQWYMLSKAKVADQRPYMILADTIIHTCLPVLRILRYRRTLPDDEPLWVDKYSRVYLPQVSLEIFFSWQIFLLQNWPMANNPRPKNSCWLKALMLSNVYPWWG